IKSGGALLQTHAGSINGNTGGAAVERETAEIYRLDYTMWSSPTASDAPVTGGQTLLQFSPETVITRFYTYNTTDDEFNAIAPSNQFLEGRGYLIRAPNNHPAFDEGDPQPGTMWTGTFKGTPNSGTITVPLAITGLGYNM